MVRPDVRDVLDIHDLIYTYAAANDDRDLEAIAACFESSGSFGLQVAGEEPLGPFSGAAMMEFFAGMLGVQSDQRRHVITNVRVREIAAAEFEVKSYFSLIVTDAGSTQVLTAGEYTDVVRRNDGSVKFVKKMLQLDAQP